MPTTGRPATPDGTLAVLAFHGVDATDRSDPLTVTPSMLKSMLTALLESGLRPVGLTEALADPAGAVALTFDDGYADFLSAVTPMQEAAATATLYVPSGHVGGTASWLGSRRPLLAAEELRGLAGLVEIGCHGSSHVPLDVLTPAGLRAETVDARASLEATVGAEVVSFAYPHGYWHKASRDAVAAAGFTNASVLGHGLHRLGSDPLTVRRILMSGADDPASLLRRIGTARPTVRRLVTTGLNAPWRAVRKARHPVAA